MERLFVLKMLSRTQRATKVKKFVGFSLKPLRCRDPALPPLYGHAYSRPFSMRILVYAHAYFSCIYAHDTPSRVHAHVQPIAHVYTLQPLRRGFALYITLASTPYIHDIVHDMYIQNRIIENACMYNIQASIISHHVSVCVCFSRNLQGHSLVTVIQ